MWNRDTDQPIHSSLANDPNLAPAIERFVIELAERIDRLQDAEAQGDLVQLGTLSGRLAAASERLGFAHLAHCGAVIVSACESEDPEAAHKGVVEVTDVARRIRMGHRGAA